MAARAVHTIEVELDQASAEKLARVLVARGTSASEFFRHAISEASRLDQVARLAAEFRASPLLVPDLETLRREVVEAGCPGEPCPGAESGH